MLLALSLKLISSDISSSISSNLSVSLELISSQKISEQMIVENSNRIVEREVDEEDR